MSRFNLHRWLVTVAILLVGPAVPAGATTMSPPFIKLPFRCVIESGRPIAVSEGSFWHQVLSGDTETRAGNANISTFTQQRSGFIKGFKFTYSSYVNVYRYEIQCDGGSADAAQVALMTGEVSDAPPDTPEDLQHARLFFRDDRLITNVDALSSGLSTGPPILMQRFEHWNPELGHFDIPVHGGLPLLPPSPSPFPEWLTGQRLTAAYLCKTCKALRLWRHTSLLLRLGNDFARTVGRSTTYCRVVVRS